MQGPTNDNPLSKRAASSDSPKGRAPKSSAPKSSSPEGGLAASIEAAAKHNVPPPNGKGLAMVALAILVIGAVVFQVISDANKPLPTRKTAKEGTQAPSEVPTTPDARFDLPGNLPGDVALALALELTKAAHADPKIYGPALEGLSKVMKDVPAELRDETNERVLVHLTAIADGPARGDVLRIAAPLAAWQSDERGAGVPPRVASPVHRAATHRLAALAAYALGDAKTFQQSVSFIRELPDAWRPAASLRAMVFDKSLKDGVRAAAAGALSDTDRQDLLQTLGEDPETSALIKAALSR